MSDETLQKKEIKFADIQFRLKNAQDLETCQTAYQELQDLKQQVAVLVQQSKNAGKIEQTQQRQDFLEKMYAYTDKLDFACLEKEIAFTIVQKKLDTKPDDPKIYKAIHEELNELKRQTNGRVQDAKRAGKIEQAQQRQFFLNKVQAYADKIDFTYWERKADFLAIQKKIEANIDDRKTYRMVYKEFQDLKKQIGNLVRRAEQAGKTMHAQQRQVLLKEMQNYTLHLFAYQKKINKFTAIQKKLETRIHNPEVYRATYEKLQKLKNQVGSLVQRTQGTSEGSLYKIFLEKMYVFIEKVDFTCWEKEVAFTTIQKKLEGISYPPIYEATFEELQDLKKQVNVLFQNAKKAGKIDQAQKRKVLSNVMQDYSEKLDFICWQKQNEFQAMQQQLEANATNPRIYKMIYGELQDLKKQMDALVQSARKAGWVQQAQRRQALLKKIQEYSTRAKPKESGLVLYNGVVPLDQRNLKEFYLRTTELGAFAKNSMTTHFLAQPYRYHYMVTHNADVWSRVFAVSNQASSWTGEMLIIQNQTINNFIDYCQKENTNPLSYTVNEGIRAVDNGITTIGVPVTQMVSAITSIPAHFDHWAYDKWRHFWNGECYDVFGEDGGAFLNALARADGKDMIHYWIKVQGHNPDWLTQKPSWQLRYQTKATYDYGSKDIQQAAHLGEAMRKPIDTPGILFFLEGYQAPQDSAPQLSEDQQQMVQLGLLKPIESGGDMSILSTRQSLVKKNLDENFIVFGK